LDARKPFTRFAGFPGREVGTKGYSGTRDGSFIIILDRWILLRLRDSWEGSNTNFITKIRLVVCSGEYIWAFGLGHY
jgi:hypothetical protein